MWKTVHHLKGIPPDYYASYAVDDLILGTDPFLDKVLEIIFEENVIRSKQVIANQDGQARTTQQLDIHIQKEEIEKVSNQIVLVVGCALKENLSPAMQAWASAQHEHPFSIVLTVQDETKLFFVFSDFCGGFREDYTFPQA